MFNSSLKLWFLENEINPICSFLVQLPRSVCSYQFNIPYFPSDLHHTDTNYTLSNELQI